MTAKNVAYLKMQEIHVRALMEYSQLIGLELHSGMDILCGRDSLWRSFSVTANVGYEVASSEGEVLENPPLLPSSEKTSKKKAKNHKKNENF